MADVTDPDGLADVEQVWLEIQDMNFSGALQPSGEPGRFVNVFPEPVLPSNSLPALMGRPLRLRLVDRAGIENVTPPYFLVRVIDATPVATTPTGGVVLTDPRPAFQWQTVRLPYPFRFRIEIFRDEGFSIRERVFDDLPADSTSLRIETPLPSGQYFWTVSIVDEFGNRSRSNQEGFFIQ